MNTNQQRLKKARFDRLFVIQMAFIALGIIIVARLFQIQIIKQDYYRSVARDEQFKELEIEPERGILAIRDNENNPVIIAVNESKFVIFADPKFITDSSEASEKLANVLGLSIDSVETKLKANTRYAVLARKVAKDVKEKVKSLDIKGVAWKEERIRSYPQGAIAAHVLGFVNDEGVGQYGVEGYLDNELKGTPGRIRAVTDIQGTPLLQNKDNIVEQPRNGTGFVLTINQTIQRIVEDELKAGVERSGAKGGSVVVMESDTGRVVGMANYPSYDPSQFRTIEDPTVFQNNVVSNPLEPGSITKILTLGAGLDSGAISINYTYPDSGSVRVDDALIKNVTQLGEGTRSVIDILHYSLNTGAINVLSQMGGGELNEKGRIVLYDYLAERFRFGKGTGIEQAEESVGYMPSPTEGDGLRVKYANMSFGQGFTSTMIEFAAALSASVNGGIYYQPTLVYARQGQDSNLVVQEPKVVTRSISEETSKEVVELMRQYGDLMAPEYRREGFIIGGKTGTAQIANPNGGYRDDAYNATFSGMLGKSKPKYVIIVRLNEGSALRNFSGFQDARPVYGGIITGIMDNIPLTD